MSKELSMSVAIAAYNGEKYISEQLDSILSQLSIEDEIIVSYNESTDNTLSILMDYTKQDSRIRVLRCEEKGIIPNFENAIAHTTKDIICLSDQDDVWVNNKRDTILKCFQDKDVIAVLHDCDYYDSNFEHVIRSAFDRGVRNGTIYNILKNSYQGSCMAFRCCLKKTILPIPRNIAMHDQWIGIIADMTGSLLIINNKLIKYRRHDDVMSPDDKRLPITKKLYFIFCITYELIKRMKKITGGERAQ